jgi:glycosyltransferase involved in cell wall biosynthesis
MRLRRGWLAVAWAPYSRRSEMFARELGGELRCIHYLRFQSPAHAPAKYVLQAARTLQVLFAERPRAVHVQNPPFLCGLTVYAYCLVSGARFVTEHHSAAFARVWAPALPVQRFLARRAVVNVVTSEHWARVVEAWGGRTLVMHDPFLDLPAGERYDVRPGFTIACAGTFAPDEPVEAVLEAAAELPDVHFYVTGDTAKAPPGMIAAAPPNVTFTGFLDSNGAYLGLLRAVDAVMAMTTRDHTLQLAGCEAIAVGKPLVTSDFAYLRQVFGPAAVYVRPCADGIASGVRDVRAGHREVTAAIAAFRESRQLVWREQMRHLTTIGGRP